MKDCLSHSFWVSDLPEERQTLLTEHFSLLKVAQESSQVPSRPQSLCTYGHSHTLATLQCSLEQAPSLMTMALIQPEPPQGRTQAQGHLEALPGFSVLEQPAHCRSQVVMFPFQPVEPCVLLSSEPVLRCLLCKLQVVHCMRMPSRL